MARLSGMPPYRAYGWTLSTLVKPRWYGFSEMCRTASTAHLTHVLHPVSIQGYPDSVQNKGSDWA